MVPTRRKPRLVGRYFSRCCQELEFECVGQPPPSVRMVHAKIVKGGHPQKQQQIYLRLRRSEGFVNKADDYSDDRPLHEVSHSLCQSKF